ncbi:PAS domain-containing protein [Megalodesulfovibrio gigas]|uniref:Putative Hpt sensor hybrid histidine kinase n=1 Tax=Megalodesulfovibrio gigas (strain ATCC 19364 / DSM 1382 / NCIMB 9332 / VKM B-1759) TaxID=1121448 RepID=T2G8T4_MEGG1|nr:PAS domain-containing protein [Megalodesulfovibrio gigas]AGW12698.1 putative Hpt sensor hybrid histidine kinase [Megalodesulfovibrio gigas DSM 1382 = ATCC 19364]
MDDRQKPPPPASPAPSDGPDWSGQEEQAELIRRLIVEKRAALHALEMAASLGSFTLSLNRLDSPLPILLETAMKLRTLVRFSAFGFFLVDEADGDLQLGFHEPVSQRRWFEAELERLIQDHTLAWVLQRAKPVLLASADGSQTLLLHSLATISRTRGVFMGVLGQDRDEILDPSYSLLSIIFHGCAHTLESFTLYARIRDMNRQLSEHVATLELSELALQERGQALEAVAVRHSQDLERMHQELARHMLALQQAQEESRRHEAFMRAVLEHGAVGVLVLDREGVILHCNARIARLYRFAPGAGPGMPLDEVAAPALAAALRAEHETLFASRESLLGLEEHLDTTAHGAHMKTVFLVEDPATGSKAVCRLLVCVDPNQHPFLRHLNEDQTARTRRQAMAAMAEHLMATPLDDSQRAMLRYLLDLAGVQDE